MEKLAGYFLLGQKFVKLEVLSTSFMDFHYGKLGESEVKILVPERVNWVWTMQFSLMSLNILAIQTFQATWRIIFMKV